LQREKGKGKRKEGKEGKKGRQRTNWNQSKKERSGFSFCAHTQKNPDEKTGFKVAKGQTVVCCIIPIMLSSRVKSYFFGLKCNGTLPPNKPRIQGPPPPIFYQMKNRFNE
jgi:hypothetical protein